MDLGRILNDSDRVDTTLAVPASPTTAASPTAAPATIPRTGKWSTEEERYASALVRWFIAGSLSIPTGTSLRSFLAKKLRCAAMRVSTKLSMDTLGDLRIPKKVGQKRFFPMEGLAESERQRVTHELRYLEAAFLEKENLPVLVEKEDVETSGVTSSCATSTGTSSDDESEGPMRVGSWSDEEQAYACALIEAFLRGTVKASEGMTLRAYLADRLCCNPMRISKKLATGKMGSMVVPKRLGSATYGRSVHVDARMVWRTENYLERVRSSCFSTSQGPVDRSSSSFYAEEEEVERMAPVSQLPRINDQGRVIDERRWYGIESPLRPPSFSAVSPRITGVKRSLPSLVLPSKPYLPTLHPVDSTKRARVGTFATVAFY